MFRKASILLFVSVASAIAEDAWGPPDSVHALDAVISAVNKIVAMPHLSPEKLARAKVVAADVRSNIEAVEGGKLSKQEANKKIAGAIKELTSFETEMFAVHNVSNIQSKLANLQKQLASKKAELVKAQSMMKLLKLKKMLAEKRLQLQNLMDEKRASAASRGSDAADATKTNQMVKKLLSMTKSLAAAKKDSSAFKEALAVVQAREHEVSDGLARLEAEDQKAGATLRGALSKGGATGDTKVQGMLKHLEAEEHHKFAKAEALKKIDMNNLKAAETSIQKHDVQGLQRTLFKMAKESKALESKSGKFLY